MLANPGPLRTRMRALAAALPLFLLSPSRRNCFHRQPTLTFVACSARNQFCSSTSVMSRSSATRARKAASKGASFCAGRDRRRARSSRPWRDGDREPCKYKNTDPARPPPTLQTPRPPSTAAITRSRRSANKARPWKPPRRFDIRRESQFHIAENPNLFHQSSKSDSWNPVSGSERGRCRSRLRARSGFPPSGKDGVLASYRGL